MKKLDRIILIDDDKFTNFYNEIILKNADAANEILSFQDARLALKYLKEEDGKADIIFLDINMPVMNGWEFLEEYEKLTQAKNTVIMLTSSVNQDDESKAKQNRLVNRFINKPLTEQALEDILKEVISSTF